MLLKSNTMHLGSNNIIWCFRLKLHCRIQSQKKLLEDSSCKYNTLKLSDNREDLAIRLIYF